MADIVDLILYQVLLPNESETAFLPWWIRRKDNILYVVIMLGMIIKTILLLVYTHGIF